MDKTIWESLALKSSLRQVIANEWIKYSHFPCYASINLKGDPTFSFGDFMGFLKGSAPRSRKFVTLLSWPFRVFRFITKSNNVGMSFGVNTSSPFTVKFHTYFTDYFFFTTIIRIITKPNLSDDERRFWIEILLKLIDTPLQNTLNLNINKKSFKVYQFFPELLLNIKGYSFSNFFIRISKLANILPDSDDTFILLEMFGKFKKLFSDERVQAYKNDAIQGIYNKCDEILKHNYLELARYYQFNEIYSNSLSFNYSGVDPIGGITTWFSPKPVDAPDLVVNLNVLRSIIVNRKEWSVFSSVETLKPVKDIIYFLYKNVKNKVFSSNRGYYYYIPEFFLAMFARFWIDFQTLDQEEKGLIDSERKIEEIRKILITYISENFNPLINLLNPMDAALALTSSIQLDALKIEYMKGWLEIITEGYQDGAYPYRAYEIFKGKIPTHMVYGSEATTAAFVYDALDELEKLLDNHKGKYV